VNANALDLPTADCAPSAGCSLRGMGTRSALGGAPTAAPFDGSPETLSPPEERARPQNPAAETPPTITARPLVSRGHWLGRLTQIVLIVGLGTAFFDFAEPVILPLTVAIVLALALRPAVRWLMQRHIPAPVAALAVVGLLLVPMGFLFSRFAGPAMTWIETAPATIAQLQTRLGGILRPARQLSEAAAQVSRIAPPDSEARPQSAVEVNDHSIASSVVTWTGSALLGTAETITLLYLLLASGDSFLQKAVHLMPTWRDKRRTVRLAHEIQQGISLYLFSVGWINVVFGFVMGAVLAALGLPQATMWGIAAGLLNFIPYFGPAVGVLSLGAAGLLAFDTVGAGLVPAGVYLALHLVEANLLTPLVVGRRVQLHPVVVFAALMYFVWLWGLPGAWVAVPMVVTFRIVGDEVPCLRPFAHLISR